MRANLLTVLRGYVLVVGFVAALLWSAILTGCAAVPDILRVVGAGASWLGSVLDTADAGQGAFFDRHPMPRQNAESVASQLLKARVAHQQCTAQLAALANGEASDPATACDKAVTEYDELYRLLDATGVLEGKCRDCGGAESDSPEPGPLVLPPPHVVGSRMRGGS